MTDIQTIHETLKQVMDPELNRSIVDLGMVHDVRFENGVVSFTLALTTLACPLSQRMQDDARARLLALDGVRDVVINVREMTAEEKEKIFGKGKKEAGSAAAVNHIHHAVAVMSGKGGVGKSTVAALLAVMLRRRGFRVGLLDADITGPSIPKMLLKEQKRPLGSPLGIMPVETESGIKVMSINLLLEDPNQAVIWRGPLISGAIKQFYGDVVWGELDYLVVDLPPGTSDAPLTVMQSMPLNGIVLVTTPQSLAGMIVRKASSMAEHLNIPILGVIENMSYVQCPKCGEIIEIFGPSNAAEVAASLAAPVLGRMPINPEIAKLGDNGRIEEYPAKEFESVVERLLSVMPETASSPVAPS
ncbi:MAG: Mrp/NBP35 family ATP-binding protein [Anaerolineae bacterium]|nr:Mrp/NBP35 family ATP-binding protein [Anaerolineae bacterium]